MLSIASYDLIKTEFDQAVAAKEVAQANLEQATVIYDTANERCQALAATLSHLSAVIEVKAALNTRAIIAKETTDGPLPG